MKNTLKATAIVLAGCAVLAVGVAIFVVGSRIHPLAPSGILAVCILIAAGAVIKHDLDKRDLDRSILTRGLQEEDW